MQSTLKPKQTDDPHDIVVVAPAVAPADDELSSLLQHAARLSQAQGRAASEVPAGAVVPPVDTTFRPVAGNAAVNNVLVTGRLRSIGRGAMRAFAAVLLATCIVSPASPGSTMAMPPNRRSRTDAAARLDVIAAGRSTGPTGATGAACR